MDMLASAINSKKDFVVEYINTSNNTISDEGSKRLNKHLKNTNSIIKTMSTATEIKSVSQHGLNVPFKKWFKWGSHSFILEGSDINHPIDRATTAFHELLGHGSAAANKIFGEPNNDNAVQTENLIHRIRGKGSQQIDGSQHHKQMQNPEDPPNIIAPQK